MTLPDIQVSDVLYALFGEYAPGWLARTRSM